VVVVERSAFPREAPGETLHPGVEPLLRDLGVWQEVLAAGFLRHEGHWVRWEGPLRFVPFGRDEGGPWRGFQAWRPCFDAILLDSARRAGAKVLQPCRWVRARLEGGRVAGVDTRGGPLWAVFVVDATGRHGWLAREVGLGVGHFGPRLIAHYGYAEGSCPARDDAPALAADAGGWTWTARVRPGLYQWTRLAFGRERLDREWLPPELRGLRRGGARGADVTWRRLRAPAGPGYFVAGDAAAVLDPTSSHGVLKALLSGMMAGRLIATVCRGGWPEKTAARAYCDWVRGWFEHDVVRLAGLYSLLPNAPHMKVKAGEAGERSLFFA
jgi:flavin-dependent dehydrogenase